MKLLENHVALVTGGTRGIGFAIARRFVQEGARVCICGTQTARGEEAAVRLAAEGGQVKFYPCDVSDAQQVQGLVARILEEQGSLDILVNNAGITRDQLLMKMQDEQWRAVIDTNLSSVFYLCRAVIRPMLKARAGRIVNITSIVGLMGNAGQTNYAAAKAGIIGFSKALAKEVGGRGITVNCIAPGFIQTDMTDALSAAQKETLQQQIVLGRLGQPEDIAAAALFLASGMGAYITGQTLTVDGGMVMA